MTARHPIAATMRRFRTERSFTRGIYSVGCHRRKRREASAGDESRGQVVARDARRSRVADDQGLAFEERPITDGGPRWNYGVEQACAVVGDHELAERDSIRALPDG